jgi:predicted Co/Zn/Cd cation transporter (cation efflux family)
MAGDVATERRALWVSTVVALGIGLGALAVGGRTGSGAVLLDAAFNLCFFATALATLRVARLVQRPDDSRYPFGYAQYEPLINFAKGLLIIGVGLLALIDAGLTLARGGAAIEAGLALAYALAAAAVSGATLLYLRRIRARAASPLVEGDVETWTVNTAISLAMAAAFLAALALQGRGASEAAKFVDPTLVSLVVLLTIAMPIRMSLRSLGGLLQRAPDPEVTASVEAKLREVLAGLPLDALHVRTLRPGRGLYVLAHAVVAEGADLDLARADVLRQAAVAAVEARHAPLVLDLLFTRLRDYAEPTTGFASVAPAPAGE